MNVLINIENNQLQIIADHNLIYVKFFITGEEKVLDESMYQRYITANWTDIKYENKQGLVIVKAKLKMYKTEDGGRQSGFHSGYRPNHVFEYKDNNLLQTYIGDI